MKQLPLVLATLALGGVLAVPARAGLHYQSITKTDAERGAQTIRAEGWVDGDRAKVVFAESTNPLMGSGTYLLTSDGAKTIYLVNPEEKTYAAFDLGAVMAGAGAMLKGLGPMVKISFSNQKVEKLAEEPGGAILGHPTTHYRFHTSYDSEFKVMGMGQAGHNDTVTDTWTTTALTDAGLGAWLRREPPRTGIADLDAMIGSEMKKGIQGVPLKMVAVTKTKDQRGRESTVTTSMEVTSLQEQAVPATTFAMPAGYTETQLVPTMPNGRE